MNFIFNNITYVFSALVGIILYIFLSTGFLKIKGITVKQKKSAPENKINLRIRYMDNAIENCRQKALAIYLSELKEILGTKEGLTEDVDFLLYSGILYQIGQEIKEKIRNTLRDMEIDKMNVHQLSLFIIKEQESLISYLTDKLDKYYYNKSKISRAKLYDINMSQLVPYVKSEIENIYRYSL